MKRTLFSTVLAALTLSLAACGGGEAKPADSADKKAEKKDPLTTCVELSAKVGKACDASFEPDTEKSRSSCSEIDKAGLLSQTNDCFEKAATLSGDACKEAMGSCMKPVMEKVGAAP